MAGRRVGRQTYNGFEVNLYGFLPEHIVTKDRDAALNGFGQLWDPGQSRLEDIGDPGKTSYDALTKDPPNQKTIAVFSGPQVLVDDGLGAIRDSSGVQRGTVNYTTGRVAVEFETTALYTVFVSYVTGPEVDLPGHFDQDDQVWDKLVQQPVIQRTFWAIELDASELVNQVDDFRDLAYVDTISTDNAPLAFTGYGFDSQIVDIDEDLQRAWLRSMSTMWKLKNAFRMWIRLLQNLGFDIRLFELAKKHPLNNYGENPGEIYSRTLNELTLEQQVAYERALKLAGFDPTTVSAPVTGASVTHVIGVGSLSTIMSVQVPVITDPPDWATITFQLSSLSGGPDPEVLTLNPSTGEVTGDVGATGQIDLISGTGQIDFGRILSTEFSLSVTYNVLGTPYRAARVDLEFDVDETVPYKSGDRAPEAILRAIEHVRPIHVLIRLLVLGLIEEETALISDGSCCGPNQAEVCEYEFPQDIVAGEASSGSAGDTVYGGQVASPPIVRGTLVVSEAVSGQSVIDNGHGAFVGNGTGVIDYGSGLWWVEFDAPTGGIPVLSYNYYIVSEANAVKKDVRYFADGADFGEVEFDRSRTELEVTYVSTDIDSNFKVLAPDFVAGKNYAGVLVANLIPTKITMQDYATSQTITDDGAGNLTGDVDGAGTNSVTYATGAYDVDWLAAPTDPIAIFEFSSVGAHDPSQEDIFVTFEDRFRMEGDVAKIVADDPTDIQSTFKDMAPDFTAGKNYAGILAANLIPNRITLQDYDTAQTITDNGLGAFVGDVDGAGTNTVTYSTGAYDVDWLAAPTAPIAIYEFSSGQSVGGAGSTAYAGTLADIANIVVGTVVFEEDPGAAQTLNDSAPVSNITGTGGSGTVGYLTGSLSVTFNDPTTASPEVDYKVVDSGGFEVRKQETIGAAGSTAYAFTLTGGQVVPGSVIVKDPGTGQEMSDVGEVALTGSGSGTLNYLTGAFSLVFTIPTVDPVEADYDLREVFAF